MTYTLISLFSYSVKLASQRHRRRQIHGMPPRSAKQPGRPDEASQPLLDNDDDDVLFTAADSGSDDDFQVPAQLPDPSTSKTSGRLVRFEEDVHVIAPSLRSTTASREAGSYTVTSWIARLLSVRIRPRLGGSRGRELCSKRSRPGGPAYATTCWSPRFHPDPT